MAGAQFVLFAIFAASFLQQPQSEKPEGPVMTIEREGGFAEVYDQVSVYADGRVIDEAGKVRHVRQSSLENFIRSVEQVSTVEPEKGTVFQGLCHDCFTYTIKTFKNESSKAFVLEEPVRRPSEKESNDTRTIRDFLSVVFSRSHQ